METSSHEIRRSQRYMIVAGRQSSPVEEATAPRSFQECHKVWILESKEGDFSRTQHGAGSILHQVRRPGCFWARAGKPGTLRC